MNKNCQPWHCADLYTFIIIYDSVCSKRHWKSYSFLMLICTGGCPCGQGGRGLCLWTGGRGCPCGQGGRGLCLWTGGRGLSLWTGGQGAVPVDRGQGAVPVDRGAGGCACGQGAVPVDRGAGGCACGQGAGGCPCVPLNNYNIPAYRVMPGKKYQKK